MGAVFNTGSEGADGSLFATVIDTHTIRTDGEDAHGLILNTGAGIAGATNSSYQTFIGSIDVETTGDGANGIVLGSGLGLNNGVDNTLGIGNGTRALTSGANADALVISENTLLVVDPLAGLGATIASLDNFIATGAGGRSVQNNGTIDGRVNGVVLGAGLRGNFANSGTITSSGPNALTYDTAANTDDIFELQPGGVVIGNVLAGNGNDQFILGGEGVDAFDHTLIGTQYLGFDELIKEDGSFWTLNGPDSAAVFLPATINGGTLAVDANLSAMDVLVQNGARLEGSGGVRMLNNNGAFAPGGPGMAANFNVAGDLNLNVGGTTEIDIFADGTSDMITVEGTATLGGQLAVNGVMFPAGFPLTNEYIVLTSPGDVVGTFDTVIDNLPDIDAMVTILPSTGPLDPIDPNRPGTVIVSYERAGDDTDKSILSNSVQFAGQVGSVFAETLQRRARLHRGDFCEDCQGYSFWQSGIGAYHSTGTTATATGYDAGIGGYAAGLDRLITTPEGAVRYGFAAGYLGGSANSGNSSAEVDSAHLGIYASVEENAWLFSGAMGYGFLDYDIDRGIPIPGGGPPLVASGDADGGVFDLSLAASFDLARHFGNASANGLRFAPIVRYDYINAHRDSYRESGATLLDLTASGSRFDTDLVSFGLELGRRIQTASGVRLNCLYDIRYEHILGSQNATSTAVLTTVGGAPFFAAGALERQDRIAIGLGVGADLTRWLSTHLRYDTSFAKKLSSHRGSAGVTVRF